MNTLFLILLLLFSAVDDGKRECVTSHNVTATIYKVNPKDSIPSYTKSGKLIDEANPFNHRFIAISHDLRQYYSFGDSVLIINAGKYDGIYRVEDLMPKKWSNKIDILVNWYDKINRFHNVTICKIK